MDGHLLVVPVGDFIIDAEVRDVATAAMLDEKAQILFRVEGVERTGRIAQTVDNESLEAVGVVDDRPDAVLRLQAVCIEFCLVLSDGRVFHCTLGLNHCERLSVGAKEDIIHIADALLVGHSSHLYFDASFAGHNLPFHVQNIPAGVLKHQVYEQATGFRLCVVIHKLHLVDDRSRGNGVAQRHCHLRLDLRSRSYMDRCRLRQQGFVKLGEGLQDAQFQKDSTDEIVEVEDAEECFLSGGLAIVNAQVAYLADIVCRHHHSVIGDELDERSTRHQLIQAGSLRQLDVLELIERLHQPLQRPPAVESRHVVFATTLRLSSFAVDAKVLKRLYFSQVVKVTHRLLTR
ncbi:MAG: hypothetical protein PUA96_03595 [Bacteroidales bacterium]|nr:hypothetical protein [Bacteroidales bacterium]